MKANNLFSVVFVFLLLVGWSKPSNDDDFKESEYEFEVLEYKSNAPIEGAKVDLYTCMYDIVFGCSSTAISVSKLTNAQGVCSFSKAQHDKGDKGIIISKVGYWARSSSAFGTNYLQPEALLKVHIKRQNNYPDSSYMNIEISGEDGNSSSRAFKAPIDSLMTIRVFGNGDNNTAWRVYTIRRDCPGTCSNTLIQGNFSKPLAKMEQGSFTLYY